MTDESVIYVKGVPRLLRDQFKGACAKRGRNMREVCVALFQLFAETENLPLFTPGEEQKWLQKVLKQVDKNRAAKRLSKSNARRST